MRNMVLARPATATFTISIKLIEHFSPWQQPNKCHGWLLVCRLKLRFYRCLSIKYEIKLNRNRQRKMVIFAPMEARHFLSLFFMDYSNHFLRLRSTGERQRRTLKLSNQFATYPFAKKIRNICYRKRIHFDLESAKCFRSIAAWMNRDSCIFRSAHCEAECAARASVKCESKKINLKLKLSPPVFGQLQLESMAQCSPSVTRLH